MYWQSTKEAIQLVLERLVAMRSNNRFNKLGLVLLGAFLAGLLLVPQGNAQGEEEPYHYFDETGHAVQGDFLDFFDTHGGLETFGYPITEPFEERGLQVQYFQKARIEAHPDNPDPYKIQLGLLGDELKYRQTRVSRPLFPSRRRFYFSETGHLVSYAFLDYFKEHGGVDVFGYPISEMYYENERIVQYFQRLKMEWHPEDRTTPVYIGNLGEVYVNVYRERIDPQALPQVANSARPVTQATPVPPPIKGMRVTVSLRYSVMGKKGDQVVSVLVTDDNGNPLYCAEVKIFLTNSSGQILGSSTDLLTDNRGFVRTPITVTGGSTGEPVIVRATVTYGSLIKSGENLFLIWE